MLTPSPPDDVDESVVFSRAVRLSGQILLPQYLTRVARVISMKLASNNQGPLLMTLVRF